MLLVSPGWFICTVIAALGTLLGPLVAIIIVKRRLRVPWRYFLFGALVFFLFQIISRVPIISVLTLVLGKTVNASPVLFVLWALFLALTASLCEEWGRYLGYRWFLKRAPKTWSTGVAYGLGHASLESMLLVGVILLALLIEILIFSFTPAAASQQAIVTQIVKAYGTQPNWYPLITLWERLWTMFFQIAMSVLVLQSLRRKNLSYVWLAVAFHTLLDTTAVLVPHYLTGLPGIITIEVLVCIAGILAFWWLRHVHQRMSKEDEEQERALQTDSSSSLASE
ncbi:YhfC family intramembrane metalloprotease [Ktedonospora formicarum]|uniref:Membrane protein n=1 Tax=Ktedonospora formicarum TaxID=2778364 RepID=A0A8J3MQP8_9CHLR|nr:YhfC family glutamic-type intramembrane protease [Ktedonospora formicarum]GHO43001.1 membrane protein [Ktedonospora formicarum]